MSFHHVVTNVAYYCHAPWLQVTASLLYIAHEHKQNMDYSVLQS